MGTSNKVSPQILVQDVLVRNTDNRQRVAFWLSNNIIYKTYLTVKSSERSFFYSKKYSIVEYRNHNHIVELNE